MTSKRYLQTTLFLILLLAGGFILFNYIQNDFGLFGNRASCKIWYHEKTTKYLMAHNYIGINFDGLLIGSSVSANLNPAQLPQYKLYNLSMNGGNISELKFACDKVFEQNAIKYIVICLYPYLTKNSGCKGAQIDPYEYWGSLFSMLPVRVLLEKIWSLTGTQDTFHSSTAGYNDSNLFKENFDFAAKVKKEQHHVIQEVDIDPVAYDELKEVISTAHQKDIIVFAYFTPIYTKIFHTYTVAGAWKRYQEKMINLFTQQDIVWDMNTDEYSYIHSRLDSYSDGHLSNKGAELVLSDIGRKFDEVIDYLGEQQDPPPVDESRNE